MNRASNFFDSLQVDGYGFSPQAIMRRDKISAAAKGLYGYLSSLAGIDGVCFPEQRTIVDEFKECETTIRKLIKELKLAGFVIVEPRNPKNPFDKRLKYTLVPITDIHVGTSQSDAVQGKDSTGVDPSHSEVVINKTKDINNKKKNKESEELKKARAAFHEHWKSCFKNWYASRGLPESYRVTRQDVIADRKVRLFENYKLSEILRRVDNWFNIPDNKRDFYGLSICAFIYGIQKPLVTLPNRTVQVQNTSNLEADFLADEQDRREAINA